MSLVALAIAEDVANAELVPLSLTPLDNDPHCDPAALTVPSREGDADEELCSEMEALEVCVTDRDGELLKVMGGD